MNYIFVKYVFTNMRNLTRPRDVFLNKMEIPGEFMSLLQRKYREISSIFKLTKLFRTRVNPQMDKSTNGQTFLFNVLNLCSL